MAVVALVLTACSSALISRTSDLDPRFAWPCDRLIVEWAMQEQRLQQMLGGSLKVRQIDGDGRHRAAPETYIGVSGAPRFRPRSHSSPARPAGSYPQS